jgi:hypothetical protein
LKDLKNIDQKALNADQEVRYAKRLADMHAVGREIKADDFLSRLALT